MEITLERFGSRTVAGYVASAAALVTQDAMIGAAMRVAEFVSGSSTYALAAIGIGGILGSMTSILVARGCGFDQYSAPGAAISASTFWVRPFFPKSSLFALSAVGALIGMGIER